MTTWCASPNLRCGPVNWRASAARNCADWDWAPSSTTSASSTCPTRSSPSQVVSPRRRPCACNTVEIAFRAGIGARGTFLSDARRTWLDRVGLVEPTDRAHRVRVHGVYHGPLFCDPGNPQLAIGTGSTSDQREVCARNCGRSRGAFARTGSHAMSWAWIAPRDHPPVSALAGALAAWRARPSAISSDGTATWTGPGAPPEWTPVRSTRQGRRGRHRACRQRTGSLPFDDPAAARRSATCSRLDHSVIDPQLGRRWHHAYVVGVPRRPVLGQMTDCLQVREQAARSLDSERSVAEDALGSQRGDQTPR